VYRPCPTVAHHLSQFLNLACACIHTLNLYLTCEEITMIHLLAVHPTKKYIMLCMCMCMCICICICIYVCVCVCVCVCGAFGLLLLDESSLVPTSSYQQCATIVLTLLTTSTLFIYITTTIHTKQILLTLPCIIYNFQ
ncbi:MAG: hypothetical protein ACI90V_003121, partial [Bacillariaceae sp.]|jgi:hypothetical protein